MVAAAVLLTGCDDIEYKASQYWNKGTQAAVSECVNYNRERGSNVGVIWKKCREKHQERVQRDVSVKNVIVTTIEGVRYVRFWFENTSGDIILTEFGIQLVKFGDDAREYTCFFDDAYVEPGETFDGRCSKDVLGGIPEKVDDYIFLVTKNRGVRIEVL